MAADLALPPLGCTETWSPEGHPLRGLPRGHPLTEVLRRECERLAGEALWGRLAAHEAQIEAGEVHPGDDRLVLAGSFAAQALRNGLDAAMGRDPAAARILAVRPYSTKGGEVADVWHCFADSTALVPREDVRRDSELTAIPVVSGSLLGNSYRQDLLRKHYLRRRVVAAESSSSRDWRSRAAEEVLARRIDFAPLAVALDLRSGEAFLHREALRAAVRLEIRVPADYRRLVNHHLLPAEVASAPPMVVETALPPTPSLLRALAGLRRQRGLDDDVAERICLHFRPSRIRHVMPFHRYIELYFRRLVLTGTPAERVISTWWLQYQRNPRPWCGPELTLRGYIEALVGHPAVQRLTPGMPSEALVWSFEYLVLRPFTQEAGGQLPTGPSWGTAIASAIVAALPRCTDAMTATNVAAEIVAPLVPLQWQSVARIQLFEDAGYACLPCAATPWPTPSLFV